MKNTIVSEVIQKYLKHWSPMKMTGAPTNFLLFDSDFLVYELQKQTKLIINKFMQSLRSCNQRVNYNQFKTLE